MKDYEFLRGLEKSLDENFPFVPLETLSRLRAIADQIEQLSNTIDPRLRLCVLACDCRKWVSYAEIDMPIKCRAHGMYAPIVHIY